MHRRRNYVPEDDNGNLTVLDHRLGASSVARFDYAYDANGMRTSMTDLDGLHDYTYDTLYQIIQATHPTVTNPTESFQYDAAGNRLLDETRAYEYNELNQLTEDDEFVYEYDLDGNMTLKVEKVTGDSTKLFWDIENRLVKVEKPGTVAEYSHGPLGRRLAKTVNGTTTQYRYDGQDLILELDDAANVAGTWTFGPGIDQPLAMNRGGVSHYYLADGLGSVTALTDEAGATVQTYEYGVFGEITERTASLENPFAYTGREWEPEVGLYYYRMRWYDPASGRFLAEDPAGLFGGDINLRRYVSNSPVLFHDPLGLWQVQVGGGYGIAGYVTLGVNDGRFNIGGGLGVGLGFEVQGCKGDDDPNRPRSPEGPCNSPALQLGYEMFGEAGIKGIFKDILAVEGGLKLFSKMDECGVEVGWTATGILDVPGAEVGGSVTGSFYGDNTTGEYTAQIYAQGSACAAVGAFGFMGPSMGYTF